MRLFAFLLLCSTTALAQQPASTPGTGSVTGRVTCADTKSPARFATVTIFAIPGSLTAPQVLDPDASEADQAAAQKTLMEAVSNSRYANVKTNLDGDFVAGNIDPGDYYVVATGVGYVESSRQMSAAYAAAKDKSKPPPDLRTVHVSANGTVQANLTMQRGASVSGELHWDDGSPAAGVQIFAEDANNAGKSLPNELSMLGVSDENRYEHSSDDLGHFRISGLSAGEYYLVAHVRLESFEGEQNGMSTPVSSDLSPWSVTFYAPSAMLKRDAKLVKLAAGEDRRDQVITLNLRGLHTVSGHVTSARDHHALGTASVELRSGEDKDFSLGANVDSAGNFTIHYVPQGIYELAVRNGQDTASEKGWSGPRAKPVLHYEVLKQPLAVTDSDVTGLALELQPMKVEPKRKRFDQD